MVTHLTRFELLKTMAIFATYLRAGRGSEPVWFRGPKTSPKVPVIYGATSGGPNPKLMTTLEKTCPPPLNAVFQKSGGGLETLTELLEEGNELLQCDLTHLTETLCTAVDVLGKW